METLNLNKIISLNENDTTSILYESMQPYLKSLYVYYKNYFNCEPVCMVTSVSNAAQYVKIVASNDFYYAICAFLEVDYIIEDETEEGFNFDNFAEYETINFNSKMLIDLIK